MAISKAMEARAYGTLMGLAIGDALGMPAQTLSREVIAERYGRIEGFCAPFEGHPVSHGLSAGQVTDDTEQALLLAKRLIDQPRGFDDLGWARDLLAWEADVRAKGLSDLLGPSSRAAIDALLAGGSPEETGRNGTTNGAAMRIAPVGIMTVNDVDLVAARVARACRVTHNTGEAIAGASAVAMMISCGIAGQDLDTATTAALAACRAGQKLGCSVGETDMAGRIEYALELAEQGQEEALVAGIGTSVASRESVPMAFGLLRLTSGSLWAALLLAANIGDDTDTIGAIAGAMAGALGGEIPQAAEATILAANAIELRPVAGALLALRSPVDAGETEWA